ncbi:NAD-dependent succinate-semialdehyde dehydrogenase [Shouchella sp. JSM 1781072]|uniref:NAD-dependent succinate-semialdehyde dehydrogenase n=1 Tax=Shouchella sp. JSM 1781072 TaxID=3344581 RepID=UPI0035C09F36
MFINGDWIETKQTLDVRNPGSGEVYRTVGLVGKEETLMAIDAAETAFAMWSKRPAVERAQFLERVAVSIEERKEMLAQVICSEMGKPIANARGEVAKSATFFKWFAEEARRVYGETIPSAEAGKRLHVIKQPLGVVGAITPWNFPLSMIARKLAPALAAGCTVVLRPSSQAPCSAIELLKIIAEVGVPKGVVNLIIGPASELSNTMMESRTIKKISFTGSTEVGKKLIRDSAQTVKRLSMELGGHAPFIVFNDADLELAVKGALTIKFNSSGQQCVCANRIYIQDDIYDAFETRFLEEVKALKVGNGFEEGSRIGPLINHDAVQKVDEQVQDARKKGATVKIGGRKLTEGKYANGAYYEPTVLTDVKEGMDILVHETFGPVAPLMRFSTEEEVIAKANHLEFGLASYAYTNDLSRMYRLSEQLEYGIVGINDPTPSTVEAPFGGLKESGLGREGGHGIDEYVEEKFISVAIKVYSSDGDQQ